MDSKYFTPKLEDFIYGYEYEQNIPTTIPISAGVSNDKPQPISEWGITDHWYKLTFKEPFIVSISYTTLLEKGYIRVPYLTKEDIVAEGWALNKESDNNYIYCTKGFSKLRYDIAYNMLAIFNTIDTSNGTFDFPAFYGSCKDKSTFRFICKLLNI